MRRNVKDGKWEYERARERERKEKKKKYEGKIRPSEIWRIWCLYWGVVHFDKDAETDFSLLIYYIFLITESLRSLVYQASNSICACTYLISRPIVRPIRLRLFDGTKDQRLDLLDGRVDRPFRTWPTCCGMMKWSNLSTLGSTWRNITCAPKFRLSH